MEKQLAKKDKAIEAKNKAIGNKDDELKRQYRKGKQEEVSDYADLRNLFKEEKQEEALDIDLSNLFDESTSPKSQPTKPEDEDIFYDAEPGEEKNTENHSPENHSTQNGQSWTEWGLENVKTVGRGVKAAAPYAITTALTGLTVLAALANKQLECLPS